MPRLPYQVMPAPSGMDSTSDTMTLPPNRAARLQNFTFNRAGKLRGSFTLTTIGQAFPAGIDGLAYYQGTTATADRLLVVSAGSLWAGTPTYPQTSPPTYTAWTVVGSGFTTGKQVRTAAFNYELIFVQEDGIQPLRYDGTGLYQLGISPPSVAPVAQPGVPSGGASTHKSGTITYKYTLYDNHSRESDVSPGASINFTTFSTKDGWIQVDFGTDPQVRGAYIYANTAGGALYYRIATLPKSAHTNMYEDNALDSIVNTGTQAPTIGENTVPALASCVCAHREHVFLNSVAAPSVLQVSNIDNPTLFSSVTVLATDGLRLTITTDPGDPIVAILPFGSLLGIWKRRAFYQLWGDTATEFTLRPLFLRGTVAPASCVRCDNDLFALLDDGVYRMNYDDGFLNKKVSQEIDADLATFTEPEKAAAVGAFADNRYYLAIGETLFFFDFTAGGWGQYQYAAPTLAVVQPGQVVPLASTDSGGTVSRSYTRAIAVSFGPTYTGYEGSVGYTVKDASGVTLIARTTSGVTERTDAAGNKTTGIYDAASSWDSSWAGRILWDITGVAGVAAEETF